jgi:hypothetical protein
MTKNTLLSCPSFIDLPSWATFFYYASSRDSLIALYESLLDDGFHCLEQPHEVLCGASFIAKLVDQKGRHILLRSK